MGEREKSQRILSLVLALTLTDCMSVVSGHDSSEPQFAYLYNGGDDSHSSQVVLTASWKQ